MGQSLVEPLQQKMSLSHEVVESGPSVARVDHHETRLFLLLRKLVVVIFDVIYAAGARLDLRNTTCWMWGCLVVVEMD